MAFSKKLSETGWFYHAPAKPANLPQKEPPPASQIPGLSDLAPEPPQPPPARGWVRDTDSKYIRLAKQGGRPDLLRYRSPKPQSDQAVGYPRVDWFYLEDIAQEEAEKQQSQQYHSMLPEYMVHEEYNPNGEKGSEGSQYCAKRAPYGFDKMSAFERDDKNVVDKTVKLPELKRTGYGIRMDKLKDKHIRYKIPPVEKPIHPNSQLEKERKLEAMKMPEENERPLMSKILSYGYAQDWDEAHDKWEKQNKQILNEASKGQERSETEYQSRIGKGNTPKGTSGHKHRPGSMTRADKLERQSEGSARSRSKVTEDKQAKELFKMSKFKKVKARTDTHRNAPVKLVDTTPYAIETAVN